MNMRESMKNPCWPVDLATLAVAMNVSETGARFTSIGLERRHGVRGDGLTNSRPPCTHKEMYLTQLIYDNPVGL